MAAEWKTVRLGRYCLKIGSGATPRGGATVYLDKSPVAFIRSQHVYNERFVFDNIVYLSEEASTTLDSVAVYKDDILINITGDSVARASMAPEEVLPARVNQHVAIIRVDPVQFDARFIRYFLITNEMQTKLLSLASSGGTRNALTKGMLEKLDVPKPPLDEQKRIAGILSAFDDKIELNRKMCKTLEVMAQALFQSWFVAFEPVKAKIAALEAGGDPELAAMMSISGKTESELAEMQAEYPKPYAELVHTASLFPAAMIETDQGEIPAGWKSLQLKKVSKQITCRIGNTECKVLSAVNTGELVLSQDFFTKQVFSKETNKYILVQPDSYAYNPSRINIGSLGRNKFDFDGCVSPIYIVFRVDCEYIAFFDQFFTSDLFRDEVTLRASGSVRQSLNYSDFGQIGITYPALNIIREFNLKSNIFKENSCVGIAKPDVDEKA